MPMYNPLHPGIFINETYIKPLEISLRQAAKKLGVSCSAFSRLIKGDSDISHEMALRLSKAFGRTPESWINMQTAYSLCGARKRVNLDLVEVIYQHAS